MADITLAEAWPLCRALDAAANHAMGRTERALTATVGTSDHCSMCGELLDAGCPHVKGWAA